VAPEIDVEELLRHQGEKHQPGEQGHSHCDFRERRVRCAARRRFDSSSAWLAVT
jgi:hypothetical protein